MGMIEKLEKIVRASADFKEFQAQGEVAKTILLISKDSEYSFEFARLLSCHIFGDEESEAKVKAGAHPDLKIYPLKERLLVADSEEIVFESSVKPVFSGKKVFIIRDIDKGMEGAQNKLLKTLEEPENNVHFILTTSNADLVLPTIRSRCVKTELKKLSESAIRDFVGDCENGELICGLSEGLVGRAQSLINKKELFPIFEGVVSVVTRLKASKDMLAYSKTLSQFAEDYMLIFSAFSLVLEDLLYIKSGKLDFVKFKSYLNRLKEVEGEYSVKAIIEIRSLIDKAVKEMMYNCNFIVVIENFILNVLEVKYLCR